MHYLIDGHNLIARMPGLSLKDPDDEAKLVALLRRWASADARRQITVIFDAGLPAGEARHLSGGSLKAVFAPNNSNADAVIIKRLEQITNPPEHTVVSSDNAVLAAAARKRVPTQRSEAFVQAMLNDRTFETRDREQKAAAQQEKPQASASEVQEWLEIFGPEPERPPTPPPPRPKRKMTPAEAEKERERQRKEAEAKKREAEIEEWLRLFGYKE